MQTESAVVLLFFAGMTAFVPKTPQSNRLDVLLVNVEHHDQQLIVPLEKLREHARSCEGMICSPGGNDLCVCDLRKRGVVDPNSITQIELRTSAGSNYLPANPPSSLTEQNAGEIAWLVNMAYVKPRAARINPNSIKGNVGTQMMNFGWTDAATCLFDEAICEVKEGWRRRIFDIEFDDWADPVDESQPAAEVVVFKAEAEVSPPTVSIKFWRNGKQEEQFLKLASDSQVPLLISNSTRSDGSANELCEKCEGDSTLSDHFRSFGRLAGDNNGLPIHRECDDYEEFPINSFPALCKQLERFGIGLPEALRGERALAPDVITLGDRIICPPAVLSN
jgi:hypothetical protein